MKRSFFIIKVLILCVLVQVSSVTAEGLPRGYSAWTKSERKVVTDKSSLFYGIHYLYADKKAVEGYRADNNFPEGSRIVVEFFNIKNDPSVDGAKNMVVLMQRDKRQKNTGGWLFAGFTADGKPSGLEPLATCFGCHQKDAAQRQFVISTKKDFKRL
jgi:hypothetical protein